MKCHFKLLSLKTSPAVGVACITACNVVWVACYAAAGLVKFLLFKVAGTIVASPAAPAADADVPAIHATAAHISW